MSNVTATIAEAILPITFSPRRLRRPLFELSYIPRLTLSQGYARAGKLFLEARLRYCSVASSERALPIRPLLQFGRSNPLHLVISAEDKVDRLEACTASLPPEAVEPDAQQEAAAVAAEPDVQQEAAAVD